MISKIKIYNDLLCVCLCVASRHLILDSVSCWPAQVNPSEVSAGEHQHTPTHALRSNNPAGLHFKSQYERFQW